MPFAHTDSGMRLKVTGVELFSAGRVTAQPEDTVWDAWDPLTRHYRRLLIHRGALAGVLLMGDLPQRGNIYRFTGNGCARTRGLAVRSIHDDATAGCRTERYDKTYSGGGWARYGRPPFS